MVGRQTAHEDDGRNLAIRTDIRGKGVTFSSHAESSAGGSQQAHGEGHVRSRNSSLSGDDEPVATNLSASSMANTDTLSSSGISGHSTTMTSTTTYDDRPSASNSTATTPYAHPSLTVLELVSNTASSSALPDSFDFNVSRKGSFVAIYSASNIWLIKTIQLPRLWARTLQVKRKPVAIDITEDGFLLAVLSRESQVDVYEIHGEGNDQIKKRRTIMLVHEASSIVISPDARILITGNKFGIEVMAIGTDAPETARRTLSGPAGDALEFSDDGRTLLITGYARKSDGSALFVLPGLYDGPLTEEGEPIPQPPEMAWTGSVLFPETARIARQATLLPDADTGTFNELFAFNAEEDSWGIYDIACQRFTQRKMFLPDHQRWTRSEFVDDAMPAVSPNADLAAVALRMRGTTNIWIYEVPGWEYKPSEKAKLQAPIQPCFCIPIPSENADSLQDICALRWVKLDANVQRLVAVGNSTMPDANVPDVPLGSKGVVIVLDFDKSKVPGVAVPMPTKQEYDLDPLCPGEVLPEGSIDFEREVELVRTRTRVQRQAEDRASRRHSRAGTTPVTRARTTANRNVVRPEAVADEEELTAEEAQAAFEVPYDNQQPRSQMSLARAATVAAVSPANRRHLRALPFRPLDYRRADGNRELPHESDADNWVPPPPAYTATAEASASVSLSHPNAPPLPNRRQSSSSSIPPVPSATINPSQISPSAVYQSRAGSISSVTLLSTPSSQQDERRPSLLHPSTFPAPQSSGSIHRRRSSTRSSSHRHDSTTSSASPLRNSMNPLRRPSYRGGAGSVDAHASTHSQLQGLRRGSVPTVPSIPRDYRRVPLPQHHAATPPHPPAHQQSTANDRRSILPRLIPPSSNHTSPHQPGSQSGSLSAPAIGGMYGFANTQPQPQSQRQRQRQSQHAGSGMLNSHPASASMLSGAAPGSGVSRDVYGGMEENDQRKRKKGRVGCSVM